MTARADRLRAMAVRSGPPLALDGRPARAIVATVVIGGWMGLGALFSLDAEAYLLLGIPITIAFQALVVRRPLRALWLEAAPPLTFTPRSAAAVLLVAVAPTVIAVRGVLAGDAVLAAYGLASIVGAVGAVYAIRALDRTGIRATVQATLVNSALLAGVMVAYRLATGGFNGDPSGALVALFISVATYLPVVFVLEEVFFRGLLDPWLRGSEPGPDRATNVFGSALWGVWHLPVAFMNLGPLTIPYLVVVHCALGWYLVISWRRTGNLAAPGIAHAVSDAFRNAVAVL